MRFLFAAEKAKRRSAGAGQKPAGSGEEETVRRGYRRAFQLLPLVGPGAEGNKQKQPPKHQVVERDDTNPPVSESLTNKLNQLCRSATVGPAKNLPEQTPLSVEGDLVFSQTAPISLSAASTANASSMCSKSRCGIRSSSQRPVRTPASTAGHARRRGKRRRGRGTCSSP